MITEKQKKIIINNIEIFKEKVIEYLSYKSELEVIEKNIKNKMEELSNIADKEKKMYIAMKVLYCQNQKEESKIKKIEEEIKNLKANLKYVQEKYNKIKMELLNMLKNLPIPVNLESYTKENSKLIFNYLENIKLGKETIRIISELFGKKEPIKFKDVNILSDKIIVENVSNLNDAFQKLIYSIKEFRIYVDNVLKFYKQTDKIIERLKKSKYYLKILMSINKSGKLTTEEIAKILNIDKTKAYNLCYNLTRNNWSPNPIRKINSGEWELTPFGKILLEKFLEKYPEGEFSSLEG
ncbi:MAG: hypothetical protein Q6351_007125 [Candidatus Njordarchaeum guaymaensis]